MKKILILVSIIVSALNLSIADEPDFGKIISTAKTTIVKFGELQNSSRIKKGKKKEETLAELANVVNSYINIVDYLDPVNRPTDFKNLVPALESLKDMIVVLNRRDTSESENQSNFKLLIAFDNSLKFLKIMAVGNLSKYSENFSEVYTASHEATLKLFLATQETVNKIDLKEEISSFNSSEMKIRKAVGEMTNLSASILMAGLEYAGEKQTYLNAAMKLHPMISANESFIAGIAAIAAIHEASLNQISAQILLHFNELATIEEDKIAVAEAAALAAKEAARKAEKAALKNKLGAEEEFKRLLLLVRQKEEARLKELKDAKIKADNAALNFKMMVKQSQVQKSNYDFSQVSKAQKKAVDALNFYINFADEIAKENPISTIDYPKNPSLAAIKVFAEAEDQLRIAITARSRYLVTLQNFMFKKNMATSVTTERAAFRFAGNAKAKMAQAAFAKTAQKYRQAASLYLNAVNTVQSNPEKVLNNKAAKLAMDVAVACEAVAKSLNANIIR